MKKLKRPKVRPLRTRGDTKAITQETLNLAVSSKRRAVKLKFFLAFKQHDHSNFAYGKEGELNGSSIRCFGLSNIASPRTTDGEFAVKVAPIMMPFLDAPASSGDLIWMAGDQGLYTGIINCPWPMTTLINNARKPHNYGRWYMLRGSQGNLFLEQVPAPSESLVPERRIRLADRLGMSVRNNPGNATGFGKAKLESRRGYKQSTYSKNPALRKVY